MYTTDKINEVVTATDLVGLVRQYVDLKRVGSTYKGLCPFHAEKTPSFTVTPDKGLFYCFGCQTGGNAITFLMKINNMTFPEALEDLARRSGVILPDPRDQKGFKPRINKSTLYAAMKKADEYFQENLWGSGRNEIHDYLDNRGIDLDLARGNGLGLSFNHWNGLKDHLLKAGVTEKTQLEAGLIKASQKAGSSGGYFDVFRNRLMFPVSDPEGRVVAFAGRVVPSETNTDLAKYINSPGTDIYKKGHLLYGYHQARSHMRAMGLVFLVEGYFDYLALVQAEVKNVVASMGTALTQEQINLLRGQVKEVYLLFDGDAAGQKAASRALPALLNVELDGKVITLPQEHDPDTFVRTFGQNGIFQVAEDAQDILDYYCDRLMATHGPSLAGQAKAISEAKEMLKKVPDAAKGQLLRRKLAERLGIEPGVLTLGGFKPEPAEVRNIKPPKTSVIEPRAKALLQHVIVHPEQAVHLPELMKIWPHDASLGVVKSFCEQLEVLGKIEPEKIHLEENDELTSLISGAMLTPNTLKPDEAAVIFRDLADILKHNMGKAQRANLTAAIKEAELAGDMELYEKLVREQMESPHPMVNRFRP
jgi:DNA primase